MPSRRSGGVGTTRRKHSIGNLRRAHPASGATWNVQVVRGKMSSKCLWHACRALILGLTLMLLGAGMATLGYYADHLSTGSELRGNVTVRVKNDLKGFHLNNFSYVGPIVMGFGGFIVVASCVMTFEARDSAAKVVPARFRAGTGSKTMRSNQGSSASQRRAIGMQLQSSRWDQHFGVFRSSPAEAPTSTPAPVPFDRDALTAELIKFSKSLSASVRFSPQLRRLTHTGSVPNLSTTSTINHDSQPLAYNTNLSHLLSPNHDALSPLDQQQLQLHNLKRHHQRHHQHHHHHNHHHHQTQNDYNYQYRRQLNKQLQKFQTQLHLQLQMQSSSGRRVKPVARHTNSSSLIQRTTRENTATSVASATCALLQPPLSAGRIYWQASSFDESARKLSSCSEKRAERTRRSDTAKRHVLARQKPIEHEEDRCSPLGHRRNSTMSDSSYSGRWTVRCASIASHASSIDSRRIQVDLHSPEVMPKSILRSPKRYSSGPSATPSVEKEFRSQLSVCSEPPATIRQLSGQSSLEPCVPEETNDMLDERAMSLNPTSPTPPLTPTTSKLPRNALLKQTPPPKKSRPDTLALASIAPTVSSASTVCTSTTEPNKVPILYRSNSSRTFYRPKPALPKERDDSVCYMHSGAQEQELYDSLQVINERRTTLLKADSLNSLGSAERKLSSYSLKMPEITERENSIDIEDAVTVTTSSSLKEDTVLQIEPESAAAQLKQKEMNGETTTKANENQSEKERSSESAVENV